MKGLFHQRLFHTCSSLTEIDFSLIQIMKIINKLITSIICSRQYNSIVAECASVCTDMTVWLDLTSEMMFPSNWVYADITLQT